jgi:hypothetical protein
MSTGRVHSAFFSPNYDTARSRFRKAAEQAGLQLETYPLASVGPGGIDLSIDVAIAGHPEAHQALILSSGLHGVEGFLGSAIQLAILEQELATLRATPQIKLILIHALNPYGFAWLRRVNEDNVDPNRNFLLFGERYEGAPRAYRRLAAFLNPPRPLRRYDALLFWCRAVWEISRHGLPTLRQAVAGGQYEFPQGLFFGGRQPIALLRILDHALPTWLASISSVLHIDFHTGLGKWGAYKLLLDSIVAPSRLAWLQRYFDPSSVENLSAPATKGDVAYQPRGSLGKWCQAKMEPCDYVFLGAEFGTYSSVNMIAGLRAENQAHHWGLPQTAGAQRVKQHFQELFCPASVAWRQRALEQGLHLVMQAAQALCQPSP